MSGYLPVNINETTMATLSTEPDMDYYECMCNATAKMPGYGKALNCCSGCKRYCPSVGRGFGNSCKRTTFGQQLPSYRCRSQHCSLDRARSNANAEQTNSLSPSTVDLGWRRDLPSWCPHAKEKRVWKKIVSEADALAEFSTDSTTVSTDITEKQEGLKNIPVSARQTIVIFLRSHPRPTPELVRSFATDSGIDPALFSQYLASVNTLPAAARKNQ